MLYEKYHKSTSFAVGQQVMILQLATQVEILLVYHETSMMLVRQQKEDCAGRSTSWDFAVNSTS